MEETPNSRRPVRGLGPARRRWQFSLRSLLVLTTVWAVLLSMAAIPLGRLLLRGVLLVLGVSLLAGLIATAGCVVVNLLLEAAWRLLLWLARAAWHKNGEP